MNLALLLKEKNYSVFLSVKFIIFFVLCILTCFHGHRQRVVCPKWKICKDHFDAVFLYQRVRSFGMIQIRISDPRSRGSWSIKWTNESTLDKDSKTKWLLYSVSWCSLFRFRKQYINCLLSVFFYMSNILSFGNHEKDSSFLSEKYTI